jgi:hypothetical protein
MFPHDAEFLDRLSYLSPLRNPDFRPIAKSLATSQDPPTGSPKRLTHGRCPGMVILFDIDGTLIDHDTAETITVAPLRGRMGHTHGAVGFLQRW